MSGQGDDYTTGYLLDYNYFKEYSQMIAIDLSKQQATDADPKARQQTILTGNIDQTAKKTTFFIVEEEKRIVLIFLKEL